MSASVTLIRVSSPTSRRRSERDPRLGHARSLEALPVRALALAGLRRARPRPAGSDRDAARPRAPALLLQLPRVPHAQEQAPATASERAQPRVRHVPARVPAAQGVGPRWWPLVRARICRARPWPALGRLVVLFHGSAALLLDVVRVLKADRYCPRCREPRPWRKDRPTGARASRRTCLTCGATTRRIKAQRKRDTMPAALYQHSRLTEEADGLWSRLILRKAQDGPCKRCGEAPPPPPAPPSALPLGGGCHMRVDRDPDAKRGLFVQALGEAEHERLRLAKLAGGKRDLALVILDLRRLLG